MSILKKLKKREEIKKVSEAEITLPKKVETSVFLGIEKSVLKRPHVSEKAYRIQSNGQYVFWTDVSANKSMIKSEIEKRYGVRVISVNTVINKGKPTSFRGKASRKSISKKAVVTLKRGEKIEIA